MEITCIPASPSYLLVSAQMRGQGWEREGEVLKDVSQII